MLYLTVPFGFGYGLGRIPSFWEKASELVRGHHGQRRRQIRGPSLTCQPPAPGMHACNRLMPQLPSAAANPKGPYLPPELTEHRPTLHSEFQKLALERALDDALAEVRKNKAAATAAAAASTSSSKAPPS